MQDDQAKKPITRQRYATIFGAGVAGLTAAHELVERGFRVQVWEPTDDQRDPRRGLDVGGLARTQWSRVGWRDEQRDPSTMSQGLPILHFLQKIFVLKPRWEPGDLWKLTEDADEKSVKKWVRASEEQGGSHREKLTAGTTLEILITGICALDAKEQRYRAEGVFKRLGEAIDAAVSAHAIHYNPTTQVFEATVGSITFVAPLREPRDPPRELTATVYVWEPNPSGATPHLQGLPRLWHLLAPWDIQDVDIYGLSRDGTATGRVVMEQFFDELSQCPQIDHVFVELTTRGNTKVDADEARRRARIVTDHLRPAPGGLVRVSDPEWGKDTIHVKVELGAPPRRVTLELLLLSEDSGALPPRADAAISFRARERWLPGEHGFRFFPAFYHHLFDTMKRTPILETEESPAPFMAQEQAVDMAPSAFRYVETGRTAFDNLQPSNQHALAFSGHRPSVLTRSRPKSFEELRDYLRVFYGSAEDGGFDADPRDVSFFMLKLLQYMTSCDERRREYEEQSWWDFIEGDSYEPNFADLLLKWPKALVAMDAKSSDARTNGTTTVQITLDLFRDGGYRDGILKGPTNAAWLEHWRRYLEAQGVEFVQGRLEGLKLYKTDTGESVVLPRVTCFEPRYPLGARDQPQLLPGYFVLALSAHEAARVARDFRTSLNDDETLSPEERAQYCPEDSDLARAARIQIEPLRGVPTQVRGDGEGEFRNYAGIQFYFAEDVFWLEGQVYHPDSAFGLTTVSQARFWEDKMDWEHGYRGVLSAIIANWSGAAPGKRPAYTLTPQELAEEAWRQICDSIKGRNKQAPNVARSRTPNFDEPPTPLYWHLDDNITWDRPYDAADPKSGYQNAAPFHIVPPKKWRDLPGELDDERGYQVLHGVVLAGTYAKTYTRIPCMETANESARHAVNAILRHAKLKGSRTYCDIWDPEDRELDDFAWMKELDAKLVQRGRRHVFDLYGVEKLIRFGLRGGADDPFDPIESWRTISRILRNFSRALWNR
jgi:hypothetical protein